MDKILLYTLTTSLIITCLVMPFWIRKAKSINLTWMDMNKWQSEKVAGSGGIVVVLGFLIGVLSYVAYKTFVIKEEMFLAQILVVITSVLFLAGIGMVDDLLGWQRGGLRRRHRIVLVAVAAIPLMAINAGKSAIYIPFLGSTELGLIYPLILIPIGLIGAATTFNFLAGFNGLEAGLGAILLSGLGIVSLLTGTTWLGIVCFCMVGALLGFLIFNFYPAKVFPGDVLTYPVGGLVAMAAILGNFEKIAIFFFIPYIIEVILKSRGKLIKQSFGEPKKDGTLTMKYRKIYSLNHLAIHFMERLKIQPTEKKVVLALWAFQAIIVILGFILFGQEIIN